MPSSPGHAQMTINYEGRVFRSRSNSEGGEVNADTIFEYHQDGDLVWATYAGGTIRFGTLIATADAAGNLEMRYQHISADGTFRSGRCRSRRQHLPDGRLRLHERWQWTDGAAGDGFSTIEEIVP